MRRLAFLIVLVTLGSTGSGNAGETAEDIREHIEDVLGRATDDRVDRQERSRLGYQALELLRPLIAQTPRDGELHFLLARAWMVAAEEHDAAHFDRGAVEHAIASLGEARRLAAGGAHERELSSSLADLHSKLAQFELAVANYDRAIAILRNAMMAAHVRDDDPYTRELTRLYGNSAESLMGLGRLGEAIERYRLAALYQPQGLRLPSLPYWGLGIALDRDGQVEKARAAVHRALELDPRMDSFEDASVYFVPYGDQWYYRGLAYTVRGDRVEAEASFRRFLDELPTSQWAGRAREHLAELGRQHKDGGSAPRLNIFVNGSGRDEQAVKRAVEKSEAGIRGCLGQEHLPNGRIDVSIDETGRVLDASAITAAAGNGVEPCLQTLARTWRFAAGPRARLSVAFSLDGN